MPETNNPLGTTVSLALRQLIAERRYRSGDRLPPERELAIALNVSRASIREGISRLAQEGTIIARRGSGTFVAPVNLRDIFDVRLQLEPFAAARAATLRSDSDVSAFERLLLRLEQSVNDPSAFAAVDMRIHALTARTAGNPVLVDILERMAVLTDLSRALTVSQERTRARTLRQLRKLVHAIRRGDAGAASTAMREHLEQVLESGAASDLGK